MGCRWGGALGAAARSFLITGDLFWLFGFGGKVGCFWSIECAGWGSHYGAAAERGAEATLP